MISPAAYTFCIGVPLVVSTRIVSSTRRPRYVKVIPGLSGYPQYGGVSSCCAQWLFSGVSPRV